MKVNLVRFKPDGQRRNFILKGNRCLIGRHATCDLPIPLSSVSREHCEIVVEDGKPLLRDLESRNGTYRNEERVDGDCELEPGDRVAVGPIVFTIQIDDAPKHIEPPLLDAPTPSTAKPAARGAGRSGSGSSADSSASELADLISKVESDDSSVFDLDMYLDDEDDESN